MKKSALLTERLVIAAFPFIVFIGCAGTSDIETRHAGNTSGHFDNAAIKPAVLISTDVATYAKDVELTGINQRPDNYKQEHITRENIADKLPPLIQQLFFGFDEHDINPDDHPLLEQHAEFLLHHPQQVLTVSGHADERGTIAYNMSLSERRANKVRALLMALGVPEAQLSVRALGESLPLNHPQNHDENRRVELEYSSITLTKAM